MRLLLGLLTTAALFSVVSLRAEDDSGLTSSADAWNTYRERFEAAQRSATSLGAGSCASANCHAGAKPRLGEVFLGDEWNQWYHEGKGSHFRAYKVLNEDARSDVMAELLYGPGAVAKDRTECLACHGLYVDETYRGRSYDIEDGVTCEACHGKSESWLGPHQNPRAWRGKQTVEQRTAVGFYDTRDLIHRTEKCLECHLGTASKRVTHNMMAAGHPPLTFELVSDSERVPRHWKDDQCFLSPDEGALYHARAWAVGQLVTLRESMYRLVDWTQRHHGADYALFDCYACHHVIGSPGWKPQRGSYRPLGEPTFDTSTMLMPRFIVARLAPDQLNRFKELTETVAARYLPRGGDPPGAIAAARELAGMMDELARKAADRNFSDADRRAILTRLAEERSAPSMGDYRSATQAFFAANALYCRAQQGKACENVQENNAARAIATLHDHLFDEKGNERPEHYDPDFVAAQLEALGKRNAGD